MDKTTLLKERAIESYQREQTRLLDGKRPMSDTNLDDIKFYRNLWAELGYEHTIQEISDLIDIEVKLIELGSKLI